MSGIARWTAGVVTAAMLFSTVSPSWAREREEPDGVLRRMFDTAVDVVASPVDWTPRQRWEAIATAGAVVALVGSGADESLSGSISRQSGTTVDRISRFGLRFGEVPLNLGVLSTFGLYGWLAEDADARLTFESGMLSAAVTTVIDEAVKVTFGRARPNTGLGARHFRPFSGSASFYSGHTSFAFSLAGTIDYFYPGLPGATAYALAATTAYSRVHTLAHFPSDVLAAAVVGASVARAVAKRWDRARRHDLELVPEVDDEGHAGAAVRHRF